MDPCKNPVVPRYDAKGEAQGLIERLLEAAQRVLLSGNYIGGDEVQQFESEISAYLGGALVVGVASGTDALTIGLSAALESSRRPDDQIITSPLSFSATATAVIRAGFRPRFADVDEHTFNIDPDKIPEELNDATRAIMPVDLYGRVVDVAALRSRAPGLLIIEDACQAFGGRDISGSLAGTVSDVAAFSFFPSKPLGGYGDGGIVVTNDPAIERMARITARHGAQERYISEFLGFNSRLDALQAALLRIKLETVDLKRMRRQAIAKLYSDCLAVAPIRLPEWDNGHAWHCYTILVQDGRRDAILRSLRMAGIDAAIQYPRPLHQLPPFATGQHLPVAERLCSELICLPICASMQDAQVYFVVESLHRALKGK